MTRALPPPRRDGRTSRRCTPIVQAWILSFPDKGTLEAQFDEAKIAFGEIRSIRALSQSSWAEYWGATQEAPDRNGGSYRLPGRPWRFSAEQLQPLGAPAFQGEHNREVFTELGLTRDEIDRHIASGALVSRVPAANKHTAPDRAA